MISTSTDDQTFRKKEGTTPSNHQLSSERSDTLRSPINDEKRDISNPIPILNNQISPDPSRQFVTSYEIDETSSFYNQHKDLIVNPLTPELESSLNTRNFWFLISQTWWISFLIHLDESTLSQASTMGIFNDIEMSKKQYNDLFVLYYVGYLVALYPGSWISQRVGNKKYICGSLFLWAVLIGVHPLVKRGEELMAIRFILGMTASQIIPSTTILHQSFFPPKKSSTVQLVWWSAGTLANILLTMVAYRLIKSENGSKLAGGLSSWKWLHIICMTITVLVFIPLVVFLPNSPVDAKWLTTEQKIHTIEIIRSTHSGIANKHFKWSQVKECFIDVKSWLFIFHMFCNEIPNNTSQQLPLIIVGFGFTPAESALFNIVKPIWGMIMLFITAGLLYSTDIGVGYACALSYIPCIIGGIIELSSPWSNKVALVVGTQISTFKPSYLLGLTWAGITTTGHTKKMILMATCVISASVANMVSPEFWQEKYQPRYRLPWTFMTISWIISPLTCISIRQYLKRENKRRDELAMEVEGDDKELFTRLESDCQDGEIGNGEGVLRISEEDLDLTDRQNLKFRYPL